MKQTILKEIREIKLLLGLKKQVLTFEEFCIYAGISKHHAYQLTSRNKIKFYRPFGKLIYFNLEDVEQFLLSNKVSDDTSNALHTSNYILKKLIN